MLFPIVAASRHRGYRVPRGIQALMIPPPLRSAARPAGAAGARSGAGGGADSVCLDGSSALTGADGGGSTRGWQRGCEFGATALAARPAPPGTA